MDCITFLFALFFLLTCIHVFTSNSIRQRSGTANLPPGPYPFPVIGNIFSLGDKPNQSLATLSKIYGPLMSLKLGTRTTIVVSSAEIAREVLQKHDLDFSSRTIPESVRTLHHNDASIGWLPVSSQWRNLRKICKEQMFTWQKLDAGQVLRQKKVQELLEYVNGSCAKGEAVDIGRAAFTTALNLLSNTFFSIDLAHHHSNSSQEFKDMVWGVMELMGRPNLADYFPVLQLIDPQGIQRHMKFYFVKLFSVFEGLINQRVQSGESSMNHDVLQSLLRITEDKSSELRCNDIKNLLLDLFLAGTDTTSTTVEWAMTELLKNPEKMAKARAELEETIGRDKLVQESDISRLGYLQAVVKETFRLHPPGPFLVPRKAESDVELCGFMVPKNAQVLINVWATGRDSSIWHKPELFEPERFLDREIDVGGKNFKLIPFGSGRRICPGMPLAHRMVHLMLASLLHSFEWKIGEGMKPEDIARVRNLGLLCRRPCLSRLYQLKCDYY